MAQYTFLIALIIFIIGLLASIIYRKNKLIFISALIITILSLLWLVYFLILIISG